MTETRKTRPRYSQYQGRAVETGAASRQATTSTHDSTTAAGSRQPLKISDFLSPGQQNARPLQYLKEVTGLPGREVRRMIEAERRQGCPILSDNVRGYFLPGDQAERDSCVRSLRRRAKEIERTADAIDRAVIR